MTARGTNRRCGRGFGFVRLSGPTALASDAAHPTVIELFQSQGCSSCPPAEASVVAVSERPDVLALSFEVDYWDRLGWKDTFSKAAWTARQYAYARALGLTASTRLRWSSTAGSRAAPWSRATSGLISRGDRGAGGPNVDFSGGAVTVGAGAAPAGGADVWLARYIPHTVEVTIPRGENAGRTLPFKGVVQEMVLLGKWRGEAASFPVAGGDPGLAEAALLQASGAGPILAAAKRYPYVAGLDEAECRAHSAGTKTKMISSSPTTNVGVGDPASTPTVETGRRSYGGGSRTGSRREPYDSQSTTPPTTSERVAGRSCSITSSLPGSEVGVAEVAVDEAARKCRYWVKIGWSSPRRRITSR